MYLPLSFWKGQVIGNKNNFKGLSGLLLDVGQGNGASDSNQQYNADYNVQGNGASYIHVDTLEGMVFEHILNIKTLYCETEGVNEGLLISKFWSKKLLISRIWRKIFTSKRLWICFVINRIIQKIYWSAILVWKQNRRKNDMRIESIFTAWLQMVIALFAVYSYCHNPMNRHSGRWESHQSSKEKSRQKG